MENEMDETRIQMALDALIDKSEIERDKFFKTFKIPEEEQCEVLKRIKGRKERPPRALSAQELKENENFRQLIVLARRGKAILFVGSGVSADVGMPSTDQLMDVLQAEAKAFQKDIPQGATLAESARIVENLTGRMSLIELLRGEFDAALKSDPPPYRKGTYRLLPAITQLSRLIITTNWDDILHRAIYDARKSATEITQGGQLAWLPMAKHAIVKLHGSFDDPKRMTITGKDFDVANSQIVERTAGTLWGHVASLMAQYSFIFVGYNLEDPDFQLIRRMVAKTEIWQEPGSNFMVAPLSPEEEKSAERWASVRVIPTTATNFLLALFKELGEFANRLDELDQIFRRQSPPFIEFHGHFGSGKSALLDEAEARARVEEWQERQVLRVNWDQDKKGKRREPVKDIQGIVQVLNEELEPAFSIRSNKFEDDIQRFLNDKRNVFLIFDATECVEDKKNLGNLIAEIIAPAIRKMNKEGKNSKLLLAGRIPLQDLPYGFRCDLSSQPLSPLTLGSVYEMALKFLLAADPDSQEKFSDELIADIIDVSGGNTHFVKTILADIALKTKDRIQIPDRLDDKQLYIKFFNEEIDDHICWKNSDQKKVYEELFCVFRWLNREIVRKIESETGKEYLLSELTDIFVLSPVDYKSDPVIRRIKMHHMQYNKPEKYAYAQKQAKEIFASGIRNLGYPMQLDYIFEWLFHTAHLLITEFPEDKKRRYDELKKQISGNIHLRANLDYVQGNIGEQLVNRITKQDVELLDTFRVCVGKDNTEDIIKLLEIKEVSHELQS